MIGNSEVSFSPDFLTRVGFGKVPGWSFIEKFGDNPDVDTGTYPEDIWSQGGVYTFSTTADIDTISSSSAADTIIMSIQGLDENWDLVTQTATLDGQNKVTLTTPLIRCFRAWNADGTALAGDVYVYVDGAITGGVPNVATTIRVKIPIGSEQTEMCIYTIPNGYTGYFLGGYVALSRSQSSGTASITSRLRLQDGIFRVLSRVALQAGGASTWDYRYPVPLEIPAKSDLLLRVDEVSANNMGVSGGFTVLLVQDTADDPTPSLQTISVGAWKKITPSGGVVGGTVYVMDSATELRSYDPKSWRNATNRRRFIRGDFSG